MAGRISYVVKKGVCSAAFASPGAGIVRPASSGVTHAGSCGGKPATRTTDLMARCSGPQLNDLAQRTLSRTQGESSTPFRFVPHNTRCGHARGQLEQRDANKPGSLKEAHRYSGGCACVRKRSDAHWRLSLNVGLKRTRSSDTDRSRRERTAGLEWLFIVLGHRWKRLIHLVGIDLRVIGDRRQYVKKGRRRRERFWEDFNRFLAPLALSQHRPRLRLPPRGYRSHFSFDFPHQLPSY